MKLRDERGNLSAFSAPDGDGVSADAKAVCDLILFRDSRGSGIFDIDSRWLGIFDIVIRRSFGRDGL